MTTNGGTDNDAPSPTGAPDAVDLSVHRASTVNKVILFCLQNKLVVGLVVLFVVLAGIVVAPFDWQVEWLPRSPVPVDAIPDIGENQQIVFTEWEGRSPQDVEDQISYPLTTALLGIPRVKTIRTYSYFGFSSIFIIFEERADFYDSRTRILEKLNSLQPGSLPQGVQPVLGPDATALGQVFWYMLEGRDQDGKPAGGWDLDELRSIQDWHVRYALLGSGGVAEVASIGGFVMEYQVDVDPNAMRAYNVSLEEIFNAVRQSNIDVGARTIELNRVEYVIRGLGFIKDIRDIEQTVVKVNENVPVYVNQVANVSRGPEMRRGVLDVEGAEAVGGVVVARYGANPLEMIKNVKQRIEEISPGLPAKVLIDDQLADRATIEQTAAAARFEAYAGDKLNHTAWIKWLRSTPRDQWPAWASISQVTISPFYDRTGLIYETLGTLNDALLAQVLITMIVIIIMAMHFRSSLLISMTMPLAVLLCFIAMRLFGVDANIVALSGIVIAIGTIVDMGIIITENVLKHLAAASPEESRLIVVYRAASEVGSAVLTAVSTTVVSFLPVFTMTGQEGKLFRPLAFTKTFALIASVVAALTIIPPLAHLLMAPRKPSRRAKQILLGLLMASAVVLVLVTGWWWAGLLVALFALYHLVADYLPARLRPLGPWVGNIVVLVLVGVVLTREWMPLGPGLGLARNLIFVFAAVAVMMSIYLLLMWFYEPLLRWFLGHKLVYVSLPLALFLFSMLAWLGFGRIFAFVPAAAARAGIPRERIVESPAWSKMLHAFPGFGREFMPPLDEGSFLFMPTTMPHASIGEAMDIIAYQDRAISSIPEVENVVGKLGRAESPLDPAPINMIETVINYKSEYATDENGRLITFKVDPATGQFVRDQAGNLISDPKGQPYRQWRESIKSPDDIWKEIIAAAEIPGTTSAPRLQPIGARIVMLQSGMRAPMGIKIKGPDLQTIEQVGIELERLLKQVPMIEPSTVIADRIVANPYLEIDIDRNAIARYGLSIRAVQDVIEMAIGGMPITTTVEGRERYNVRVRYQRELRDRPDQLARLPVSTMEGQQIPLEQLADIRYVRGPMVIKSEDTFLVGYVLFDKRPRFAEVDVVENAQSFLRDAMDRGEFVLPAGVSYSFAGSYENQVRAQKTLSIVLPLALFLIFLILYFQFSSYITTFFVFSGIAVAWSGGFLLLWLYGQPWFLDFSVFGVYMRELFQVHPINLSIAIWVGFLALFGIATDDGVVIATYLDQKFAAVKPASIKEIRDATVAAGLRRIRPCLMTTATTVLALLPVLTSRGRGADIMVPMAIPSFGGMTIALMTLFLVPLLYCWYKEMQLKFRAKEVAK